LFYEALDIGYVIFSLGEVDIIAVTSKPTSKALRIARGSLLISGHIFKLFPIEWVLEMLSAR
jgi:hypothetical protein